VFLRLCIPHDADSQYDSGVRSEEYAAHRKEEHITKRTTREKLLSYLSEQSRVHNSNSFEMPFDRQGLADYLSVERSALSTEMSKLKSDGVMNYRKSHFELSGEPND
jgi:CRP-like cAMP-binding protein